MSVRRIVCRFSLAAILLLGVFASPCEAQWTWSRSGGSHSWNSGGSWSGSRGFPNSLTAVANINNNITSNQVISIDSSVSTGTITLGDSTTGGGVFQNFTIQSGTGTQTLTLGIGGITSSNSINTIAISTVLGASTIIQHGTATGNLQLTGNVNLASFALTVNGSGSTSIAGSISGAGSLVKLGSSNLVLSGNNSYTGGTTVTAGSITGSSASLQGSIINNATVVFNQVSAGTYSGAMSGSGALMKVGAGNLTLSGINSYIGGTTVSAGTLTGTTTSLQGSITNNSILAFNQSTSGVYSGAIGGNGSLVKLGTGNVTLAGNNTYSGGTTVTAGTLTGNSNTLQGSIINNSVVAFDQATNGVYSGSMSGSGSLVKLGSGTLTLAGNNSYGGGTTVSAGTIIGSTTSLQGAIVNDSSVVIDQNTNGTYSGSMSGSGSLEKTGSGDVTLAGTNSYSGGTTVSEGKLIGDTASIQGAVANNGTVEFSQTSNGTYSGNITGTGKVVKSGSGTVEFAGAQSFIGDTLITAGALRLNSGASLASSKITIETGATLDVSQLTSFALTAGQTICGSGQIVGGMTHAAGSTLSPGASPGTLTVNGDLTLEGAAIYSWEINDATGTAGNSIGWDLLATTGTLIINATSANPYVIQVSSLLPSNSPGDVINFDPSLDYSWEILSAAGGISGFDSSAFVVDATGFTNDLSAWPGHSFEVRQSGNSLFLHFVSVPEPSVVFVSLLIGLGIANRRSRNR